MRTPKPLLSVLNALKELDLGIRPKVADHISLAYANKYVQIDEERYNSQTVDVLERKAREMVVGGHNTFAENGITAQNGMVGTGVLGEEDVQWDLVLYRVGCSESVEVPHAFCQLKRWRVS